ncbi:MAG: YgiT-type zinc finger protein [Candidatus Margulisbacteria bacterium]|nr:YgiT-type zinc finger protein [Candidatus Margulisiibacteriota bacterium]
MKRGKTSYTIDRQGYHFTMYNVAAWLCEQCGETVFEEKEVGSIQNLIKTLDSRTAKISKFKLHSIKA